MVSNAIIEVTVRIADKADSSHLAKLIDGRKIE